MGGRAGVDVLRIIHLRRTHSDGRLFHATLTRKIGAFTHRLCLVARVALLQVRVQFVSADRADETHTHKSNVAFVDWGGGRSIADEGLHHIGKAGGACPHDLERNK